MLLGLDRIDEHEVGHDALHGSLLVFGLELFLALSIGLFEGQSFRLTGRNIFPSPFFYGEIGASVWLLGLAHFCALCLNAMPDRAWLGPRRWLGPLPFESQKE